MKKTYNLGYIQIADYTPKSKIFPKWMYEDTHYADEINRTDPNEKLLDPGEYSLVLTYPLHIPAIFELKSKKDLTRKALIKFIVECYQTVYKEEAETTDIQAENIPGMLNRCETNGKYGIWGHVIEDLTLCSLTVQGNKLTVGVDS